MLTICFDCHTKIHNKTITQEQLNLYSVSMVNGQLTNWYDKKNIRAIRRATRRVKVFKIKNPALVVPEFLQQIPVVKQEYYLKRIVIL